MKMTLIVDRLNSCNKYPLKQ